VILLAEHDEPSLAPTKKRQPGASSRPTSTPKNRVWGFESIPSGRPGADLDLSCENATGSVQFTYQNASGRAGWLSRDPIAEKGGLNLYEYVRDNPVAGIDPYGLGTWSITPQDVSAQLSAGDIGAGASSSGYQASYVPSAGECSSGKIVVYQTITNPGGIFGSDTSPHVDETPSPHQAPSPGALPPAMTPAGSTPNSYIDSPTWAAGSLPGTWDITAVAVCRCNDKDTLLSTHYFEFGNSNRKILPGTNPNSTDQYTQAMKTWNSP
jgi:hypothetical protein